MSWPPAAMPSITTGARFARAAYVAAVRPAGPDPTITTLRMCSVTWLGSSGSSSLGALNRSIQQNVPTSTRIPPQIRYAIHTSPVRITSPRNRPMIRRVTAVSTKNVVSSP